MKKQFLFIAMLLLPMMAAAEIAPVNGVYFKFSKDGGNKAVMTASDNKYSGKVVIPESVIYQGELYPVVGIDDDAFLHCTGLTSVSIGNNVTYIGDQAFYGCLKLDNIVIPKKVTSLGYRAFAECHGLKSLTIGAGVRTIGKRAFINCINLTAAVVPDGVTVIEDSLFFNCAKMTSIAIPRGVTRIGDYAFHDCRLLTSVTIPNTVTTIGEGAFYNCLALESMTIPSSVTTIGAHAFEDCQGMTSVSIPSSINIINPYTFSKCYKLSAVNIPNTVTEICEWAFQECRALITINIPGSVTTIGDIAFRYCTSLETVVIPSSVKTIGVEAFAKCKELLNVYCYCENLPETDINAFKDSYIESATLHVPAAVYDTYKATKPWSGFKTIVKLNGTGPETPTTMKCGTPAITYQNGNLVFSSSTDGVQFVSEITDADVKQFFDATVPLAVTYNISVYAQKTGYENSDLVTATLCWIEVDPKNEDITTGVAHISSNAVLIQASEDEIMVSGLDNGTPITVYDINGRQAGSGVSYGSTASIPATLTSGSIAIVKIGQKSIKVSVR